MQISEFMNTQNAITGAIPAHMSHRGTANAFYSFIFHNKQNRSLLRLVLLAAIVQFVVFKILYPFPDFFSDAWSYINAAIEGLDVNIWPIGYSKFLLIFHGVTSSALALNTFQYFFIITSSLYFYYTVTYFFTISKFSRYVLIIFLFFNPLPLYVANYVTSDAIFQSLSLIWVSLLLWIMYKPHWYQIFVQAIVFFIAFTFRYNAMFYPVVTALAFLVSPQAIWKKALGMIIGPIVIIPFILFCLRASEKLTGTAQFPPILGGWQWANNALYMYEHIEVDSTRFSPEARELNRLSIAFFATTPEHQRDLFSYVANYFIRQPNAPLKQYLVRHYEFSSHKGQVMAWGMVSPVFKEFGLSLTKQHPVAYVRYYMGLNTWNYFFPPLEKLEIYNLGLDDTPPEVQQWFHFESPKLPTVLPKKFQGYLLAIFPVLFCVFNLFLFLGYFHFAQPRYFKNASTRFKYCAILIGIFVLLNMGFSIFANIIVIRYQLFPMIICLTFALLLLDELKYFGARKA